MRAAGGPPRWRLVLGVIAFAVWAPPSLVGLPCAALLAAAPDRSPRTRIAAALLGVTSLALLALPGGRLAAAIAAYTVLMTAAFVTGAALAPTTFLRQALRAVCWGGTLTALLVYVVWGAAGWGALAWEATREAGLTMRFVVELRPEAIALYEPVVRFVSATTPGMLALQSLAGLALAWQWHLQLAAQPLGAPLALPLLFLLPGLCTLGITDTWYQYRRRLAARRPNAT